MRCSNCGKDIPFAGKVCPWCHADKSTDQAKQVFGFIGGLAGGALGWMIHGIIPAIIGFFVGAVAGIIFGSKAKSS
ncbi:MULTISPECIES: hypothetical protein [unclassified Mycobacterium]|uniref:hypothetical protein n=1 Tax=unclassified Mycobacterium TaxID=2642494 RepID=UPI000B15D794|nr:MULTISPECIES: hypothetical protein [unclassified Mycobacterium]